MTGLDATMFERIVVDAPEAIIVADAAGVIRFWNAAAERIFGFAAAETVGQTLDLIVPEAQRVRHWNGYREVMRTGVTRYGTELLAVPAVRKDGARISVEFYVVLLRDAAEGVVGIAALLRDVTARWQRERALQQRLRAAEGGQVDLSRG